MTLIEKTVASLGLTFLIVIPLLLVTGWVMNLVKFVNLDFQEPYKAEVIRGGGIIVYGSIIGWIKIEDN